MKPNNNFEIEDALPHNDSDVGTSELSDNQLGSMLGFTSFNPTYRSIASNGSSDEASRNSGLLFPVFHFIPYLLRFLNVRLHASAQSARSVG